MEPTEEEMLNTMGWTTVCQSPHELEHEDGSTATGQSVFMVISGIIEEYKEMKKEEAVEAEKAKKAEATKSLNLENINGREIIEFLSKAIHDNDDLCDISISGFEFNEQEVNIVEYRLHFTGIFINNWGHDQPESGQMIIINGDGVTFRLGEPFEGDGTDEALEEILTEWLKTHEFATNSEDTFHSIVTPAIEDLIKIEFSDKKELKQIIDQLNEAKTYMK